MNNLKQARISTVLQKQYRYDEGVMTRKAYIELQKHNGATVEQREVRNYAAEEKLQDWLDKNKWSYPFGNDRHPQTIHYKAEKQRLADGIFKTEYILQKPGVSWFSLITKIEYDYFNSI